MKLKIHFLALLYSISIASAQTSIDANAILQQAGKAYKRGDYQKAIKLTRPLAEQGIMEAQFNMGTFYAMGQGVTQDAIKAREWYEKAAQQGDVESQYQLGILYHDGIGISPDYQKAQEWYEKAAAQGSAKAQYHLGKCISKTK